jgi:peptidyl-tRNA hydrolase
MYILVLDDVPLGHAINTACHAAVSCTLTYQETDEVKEWLETSFRKVTCKVNHQEFLKAIDKEQEYVIMRESNLNNRVTAVAFKPRKEYHKCFKYFSLYKTDNTGII